ncbi:hypothetical [Yersinia pestis KIM10+]|uniref:Uncharacterized protein n=1 Tax=Yersinia pestis TaxID=632 RepID=Q8CKL0_YERPE|nr:hypothetical [Yersinia pestis KIM10+]
MKAPSAGLTAVALMPCAFWPVLFNRVKLLTKWTFHINLSHQTLSDKCEDFT